MNWIASIGVGLLAAPAVGLIAGTAATVAAEWLRVPNREGAAGFFAIALALIGIIVGLVLGILFSRGVLLPPPSFLKSLGLTVGSCLALSLAFVGIVRVSADLPPTIDGASLQLLVELRCPPGVTISSNDEGPSRYATFLRLASGDTRGFAPVDLKDVRIEDGRQIIPVTLPIETSATRKLLNIRVDEQRNLLFALEFGARPREQDFQWSRWIDAAYDIDAAKPTPESTFSVRTQVRKVPPPPPTLSREQAELNADADQDAALRALQADAPLAHWLVFTRYGVPQPRIDVAIAAIRARPAFATEMSHEMLAGEHEASRDALRALEHMQPPPTELAAGVAAVGHEIARGLRELEAPPPLPDRPYSYGSDISTRFSAWMVATRALQGKAGADFVPELKEILELSRQHQQSYTLRIDVVRVASFYLHEWAGIEPLPSDPPPR
jgi:hypothetical protein